MYASATYRTMWPIIFTIDFEQCHQQTCNGNLGRIAYYYNNPDIPSAGLTWLVWNIAVAAGGKLLATQPVYTTYPDITTMKFCPTNREFTGLGDEMSGCTNVVCPSTYCHTPTQSFWCPPTGYLSNLL